MKMNKNFLVSMAKHVNKWLADLEPTDKVPFRPSGGYVYIYTWKGFPNKKGTIKQRTQQFIFFSFSSPNNFIENCALEKKLFGLLGP